MTKKVPQIAIVITNWNGQQYLEPCLRSIFAQDFRDFEVLLVDNASTDDSVEFVRRHYPQVRLLQNEKNVGLCAANNRGIQATDAEFVLILNNDTELEPDCLGELIRVIIQNPKIGMAATKMLLTDRRNMIESAGIVVDKVGIGWGLRTGELDQTGVELPSPVFGACGGAALYRRAMLLEIGLFDADFFVYLEDADVAWRGQWAGWQAVYVPTARVYHAHSATIKEGSPFKTRLLTRNKIWMIAKSYPMPHLMAYLPLILLYEALSLGYAVVKGRGMTALKARLEAFRGLPHMLTKRRQMVRKISARTMMNKLHPIENPLSLWRQYISLARSMSHHYQQGD